MKKALKIKTKTKKKRKRKEKIKKYIKHIKSDLKKQIKQAYKKGTTSILTHFAYYKTENSIKNIRMACDWFEKRGFDVYIIPSYTEFRVEIKWDKEAQF
jgi:hypothetical protein